MTTLKRIKQYLDIKGISVRNFEQSIGMSNGSFASQLKNNKTIGVDKLENILHFYPDINPNWLLTGKGSIYVVDDNILEVNEPITPYNLAKTHDSIKIPLVSNSAIAGRGGFNNTITKENILDYYIVPKFSGKNIDFFIEVKGMSMSPCFTNGDLVACKIIRESSIIQWNEIHLISTNEQGLLIKRLRKSSKENYTLALSDNKDYDPIEIPNNEINGIALVRGGIIDLI